MLAWDPNPASDIVGYRLYCGTTSGVYTQWIEVGNVSLVKVTSLQLGKSYFFAVTDYNNAGLESPPSNQVSFNVTAASPTPTPAPLPSPTARPTTTPPPPSATPSPTPVSTVTPTPIPNMVISVVSRKNHGSAGQFDIPLPLTGPTGVECRTGGPSGIYQVIVTFTDIVVALNNATVASGSGLVTGFTVSRNQITVNLARVTNGQTIVVTLAGVKLRVSSTEYTLSIPMSVLIGDTTGDRFVDAADVAQTRSKSGSSVVQSDFRNDVNLDGFIDSNDVGLIKSNLGMALP
jgi:Fibronectin type III domain